MYGTSMRENREIPRLPAPLINGRDAQGTPSTAGVDRVRGRVAAGQGGRRVIIGGCEDNEERVAGRCP